MEQNNINSQNITEEKATPKKKKSPYTVFSLLCLYYIAASLYLPLSVFVGMGEWLSLAASLGICVLAGAAMTLMAGSFKPIAGYAIIVGIFAVFGGALLPLSLLVAFASGTCTFAYLVLSSKSLSRGALPIVCLIPVIPTVTSVIIVGTPFAALLALATVPAALALAYSVGKKLSRISAVCRISAGICVFSVALLLLGAYRSMGTLSFSAIKEFLEIGKTQLALLISEVFTEMQSLVGTSLLSFDTESMTQALADTIFNLLPALAITVANIAAYIIHSLYITANYALDKEKQKEALPMLSFDMSVVSAAMYIISLVLIFVLTGEKTALYGTAAQNLVVILAPGLVMTALAGVRAMSMKNGPSCLGSLLYMMLIFMIASLSPIVIGLTALGGAILIIVATVMKSKRETNNQ